MPESRKEFEPTPQGHQRRWQMEFSAARKGLSKWHRSADRVISRYLDERDAKNAKESRLNLFSADVQTREAMSYGKLPSIDAKRRYDDSDDDIARVAAEMLGRLLNSDLERDSDSYAEALGLALQDRLLAGWSNIRCRYVAKFGQSEPVPAQIDPATGMELAPAVPSQPVKIYEDVETHYVHWQDQLWPKCRTFGELPWWAERALMTRDDLVKRFEDIGKRVPLNANKRRDDEHGDGEDPWQRAEVWEIWSKEDKRVYWFVDGFDQILDMKDDPLGLDGFWPFPKPLMANVTTRALVPRPDFSIAQDLYDEIDRLTGRIKLLESALRVAGIYDGSSDAIKRLVGETSENELIPVDNWPALAEKGGIKGIVDWLPIEQIAATLDRLQAQRANKIALLYQVTGMSDIMRGQATAAATATEQSIKARFGSVRTQRFQDEFARFARDIQRLKAEIIAKHFDASTIIERSNIVRTADAQFAESAAGLIKSDFPGFRVDVKAESVSLADYAVLKQERSEFVIAISTLVKAMFPLVQALPGALPPLLEVLKWAAAGFRGAGTVEGALDRAIAQAQKELAAPKSPPAPDPRLEALKAKGALDLQRGQLDLQRAQLGAVAAQEKTKADVIRSQADIVRTRAELEAERARQAWGSTAGLVPESPVPLPWTPGTIEGAQ